MLKQSNEIARRAFGPYTATIVPNDDREGVNCFIERGRHSASLAAAQAEGYLTADTPPYDDHTIAESVTDAILDWALPYGY